jgi:hypothetical protein
MRLLPVIGGKGNFAATVSARTAALPPNGFDRPWLGDFLDRWPFSWSGSSENVITSNRDANPGEVASI